LADVSAFEVGKGEITVSGMDEDKSTASEVDCNTETTGVNKNKFTASEIGKDGTIKTKIEKGKSTAFEVDKGEIIYLVKLQ
ncbi:1046_t:CDS:2, partial [Funneliformis caledonium]